MIKDLKKWFGAAALGLTLAGPVQGATYDAGNISPGGSFTTTYDVAVGSFSDILSFNLTSSSTFAGVFANIRISPQIFPSPAPTTTLYDISNLLLKMYSPSHTLLGTYSPNAGGLINSTLSLPAGNSYSAVLTGDGSGILGGKYVVSLNAIAAPVPEPAEWMMMVAGLMVMGFIARRRKNIV